MPDNLQLYQDQQSREQNQQLGAAMHAANWTNTFSGEQSTDALRAQRNVTDLVASALERKQTLEASRDANAARIYQINQASRIQQEQAPLQDQILRNNVANTAAGNAYKATMEAMTLRDKAGFLNDLTRISKSHPPNTREHADAVAEAFVNHPYAAGDKEAVSTYLDHIKVVDRARQLAEARDAFKKTMDYEPGFVEMTATGGVNLHGKPEDSSAKIPPGVTTLYAKAKGDFSGYATGARQFAIDSPDKPFAKAGEMEAAARTMRELETQYPQLLKGGTPGQRKSLDEIFK